jgi:hypothetical protein
VKLADTLLAFANRRGFTLTLKGATMAKYGKKAKSEVKEAMHEKKKGKLKSGKSGRKVTSKKQAIAIGLSKARKKGAKEPSNKKSKS